MVRSRELEIIAESGLFDREWYLNTYRDVRESGTDPLEHFLSHGGKEGRDPGPNFSTSRYLERYPDVAAAGIDPLSHFVLFGAAEGRSRFASSAPDLGSARARSELLTASGLFDGDWYLAVYRDVLDADLDPATHYALSGAAEGRDPGPGFNAAAYCRRHGLDQRTGVDPLIHYLEYGRERGYEIDPSAQIMELPLEPAAVLSFPRRKSVDQQPALPGEPTGQGADRAPHGDAVVSGMLSPPAGDGDVTSRTASFSSDRAIWCFCRLTGSDAPDLRSRLGLADHDPACRPPADPCEPILRLDTGRGTTIVDLWYAHRMQLRLRFCNEAADGSALAWRAFQYDPFQKTTRMLCDATVGLHPVEFVDMPLASALFPVLLTATDADGRLIDADLLPFPSLCRGGLHYSELCVASGRSSHPADLKILSAKLLSEFLERDSSSSPRSIAGIEIDLHGASGTEPIFSPDLRAWLRIVMEVDVGVYDRDAPTVTTGRAYLARMLEDGVPARRAESRSRQADGAEGGICRLVLPADSIPSLGALVSRRPQAGPGVPVTLGSFAVASSASHKPQWVVWAPPLGRHLAELQSPYAPLSFPMLVREPTGGIVDTRPASDGPRTLLSIALREARETAPSALVMPIALDMDEPLLPRRRTSERSADPISVLVAVSGEFPSEFAVFLESLAAQSVSAAIRVIAVVDLEAGERREAAERALRRFFRSAHVILDGERGATRHHQVGVAANSAASGYLMTAHESLILPDPRTVETLRDIAGDDVGSSSCILLKDATVGKSTRPVFHSGGIFFDDGEDLRASPAFSEMATEAVFPLGTYPVAANRSELFLVRKSVWQAVGGFRPDSPLPDADYGVRAAGLGYLSFCTSLVSAGLQGKDVRPKPRHPQADLQTLPNLAASAVIVRALHG